MSARDWQILPSSLDASQGHSRARWLLPGSVALAIVALGIAVTASFALSVEQAARALARSTVEERATHIEHAIVERLNGCKAVLQAGAGYIDNAWPISEEQWRRFVRPLSVSLVSSGVQGFGFAAVVDKLASWQLEAIPAELWRDAMNPGDHPQTAILYLEPQDERNQRAIGFDMASESVRRAAMELARDGGEAAASAKVTLVQEIDSSPQPGFLMYVPVYQRNMPITTVAQRRQALIGYAYSPFRAVDFLDRVFQGDPADMTIEVFDGPRALQDALMYRDRKSVV